jgi:hypothetical protein
MTDQFLSNFQEPPRPEFADALSQRINTPMKTQSIPLRRFALGLSLAALVLVLTLIFSPAARAYAQGLILKIGNLFITHEPTYAEQFETRINSGTPTVTPASSPVPIEWQAPPLLTLDEASTQAGFPVTDISNLPGNLPLVARFVTLPDTENSFTCVTATYSDGQQNLVFGQTVYQSKAASQTLPVGASPVVQVTVQNVNGLWIDNLRLSTYVDENNQIAPQFANLLVWEKDGVEYWLQSTPGLPQEEMLVIANSVKP